MKCPVCCAEMRAGVIPTGGATLYWHPFKAITEPIKLAPVYSAKDNAYLCERCDMIVIKDARGHTAGEAEGKL